MRHSFDFFSSVVDNRGETRPFFATLHFLFHTLLGRLEKCNFYARHRILSSPTSVTFDSRFYPVFLPTPANVLLYFAVSQHRMLENIIHTRSRVAHGDDKESSYAQLVLQDPLSGEKAHLTLRPVVR